MFIDYYIKMILATLYFFIINELIITLIREYIQKLMVNRFAYYTGILMPARIFNVFWMVIILCMTSYDFTYNFIDYRIIGSVIASPGHFAPSGILK